MSSSLSQPVHLAKVAFLYLWTEDRSSAMLAVGGNAIRHRNRRQRPGDLITAEELATFAYCPEAWRLQHGLNLPSVNRVALEAGNRHHARKAVAERVAGGAIAAGRLVAVLGVLALLLLWVFSR